MRLTRAAPTRTTSSRTWPISLRSAPLMGARMGSGVLVARRATRRLDGARFVRRTLRFFVAIGPPTSVRHTRGDTNLHRAAARERLRLAKGDQRIHAARAPGRQKARDR